MDGQDFREEYGRVRLRCKGGILNQPTPQKLLDEVHGTPPFLKELPAELVAHLYGLDRNAPPTEEMASAFFAQLK